MERDWVLGYNPIKFLDFPDRSYFSRIQSLESIGNSWGNSYMPCLVPITALRFAWGARKICTNIRKSENVVWSKWFLKDEYSRFLIKVPLVFLLYINNLKYASIAFDFEIFDNVFIVILCVSVCDVISFEIYLLIRVFSYIKKFFSDEIENIHHVYRVFIEVNKTNYFWMGAIQKVRTL